MKDFKILKNLQLILLKFMSDLDFQNIYANGRIALESANPFLNDKKLCDIFKLVIYFQFLMGHLNTLMVDTGDKPYQCSVCQQRFSEAVVMTQHKRLHSGTISCNE